ncbi:MAG: TetR/AcrR family transcriptional regulator [Acetatifactor sp.]|nr:TetR/AcrR family transcriptional regulator [Acetatifactor sp.]
MSRDKTESHARIVDAARKEFLEYGYNDASLRRIAEKAKIQVSGLYKHFASKEEMYASLVEPVIKGFYELYETIEDECFEGIGQTGDDTGMDNGYEAVRVMKYIYDHIDDMNLLIFGSKGSKYEDFVHEVAMREEEGTLRYVKALKEAGYHVKKFNRKEFHLLTTSYVEALFQPVIHGLTKKEALHYAKTVSEFYGSAWKNWLGV